MPIERTTTQLRGLGKGSPAGMVWYYKKITGFEEVNAIKATPIMVAQESTPTSGTWGKKLVPVYEAWKCTPGSTVFDFPTMCGTMGFSPNAPSASGPDKANGLNQAEPYSKEYMWGDGYTISGGGSAAFTKQFQLNWTGTDLTQGDGVIEVWLGYVWQDLDINS